MIKRLVKMTFQAALVPDFLVIFEASKQKIRQFEGCQHLELLRDKNQPNILFTLSFWDTEGSLEQYRHSELFQTTWAKTKILFADRPQAWTVNVEHEL